MSGLLDLEKDYEAFRRRQQNLNDPLNYQLLAPAEHMEFARETVKQNPLMALPLAVMTPIYTAGKSAMIRPLFERMGLINADASPQDIDQMWAAYRGIGQGLFGR
jgi:hypothetical protein